MSDTVPTFKLGDKVRVMQTTSAGKWGGMRGRVSGVVRVSGHETHYYVESPDKLTVLILGSDLMSDFQIKAVALPNARELIESGQRVMESRKQEKEETNE